MHTLSLLFNAVGICWAILESWMLLRERGNVTSAKDKHSKLTLIVVIGGGIYGGIKLAQLTHFPLSGSSTIHLLLGIVFILFGISLRLWSILTLGNYFRSTVMVQKDQKVITSGPYYLIRHPSYTGFLLAAIGLGIGNGNWLTLILIFICVIIGLHYRIIVEEKVLSHSLGKEYQEYIKKTKRLIPFIY